MKEVTSSTAAAAIRGTGMDLPVSTVVAIQRVGTGLSMILLPIILIVGFTSHVLLVRLGSIGLGFIKGKLA